MAWQCVALVISRYWRDDKQGPGIATELAALLTYLLGALVIYGARSLPPRWPGGPEVRTDAAPARLRIPALR